ncbi:hypothetical protein vseg_009061 [Gypsophila vaccaria]
MASSKVMPTTSSTSTSTISDLTLLPSSSNSLDYFHGFNTNHRFRGDRFQIRDQMIPESPHSHAPPPQVADIGMIDAAAATAVECGGGVDEMRRRTAEEVWREIVERRECKIEEAAAAAVVADEMMTLEDFLARATAGEEEETAEEGVKAEGAVSNLGMYGYDNQQGMVGPGVFTMGEVAVAVAGGGGGGGRGKRSRGGGGMMVETLDKAAQQRQRRMIKNRESAARSRERKQAYQIELEALAAKLEEENELLLREKAHRTKQRYMQLMEKIVPVVEKRRPPRTLRRVRSMQW